MRKTYGSEKRVGDIVTCGYNSLSDQSSLCISSKTIWKRLTCEKHVDQIMIFTQNSLCISSLPSASVYIYLYYIFPLFQTHSRELQRLKTCIPRQCIKKPLLFSWRATGGLLEQMERETGFCNFTLK